MRLNSPPTTGTILNTIDAYEDEIITFAQDLLRIPTVNSPPGGEEKMGQLFLAEKLHDLELEVDLFSLDQLAGLDSHPAYHVGGSVEIPRDYRDRPNLVARWRGQDGGRSLIIAAHMDVVPPGDIDLWHYDPWGATMEQDQIYARGAIDDKGGLAAMVMAVHCLREAGFSPQGDVLLQSFVDEEFGGGNGAVAMLVRGYKADAVLMLEPTDMAVCPMTYGCQSLKVSVRGQSAHPIERWKGVDAIGPACQVYQAFMNLESRRGERARVSWPLLSDRDVPLPLIVRRLEALTPGGGAIPDLCELQIWSTVMPGETQRSLVTEVKEHLTHAFHESQWLHDHPPEVRAMGRFLEATSLSMDHDFLRSVRTVYKSAFNQEAEITVGTSGDGYIYANFGKMPLLEFGPGPIHRAHAPDEYITVEELIAATKVIALTIAHWCGAS